MAEGRGGFLRNNVFLVTAALLPAAVVVFFLLATAIPQWTVPPPAYDLVFRVTRPYSGSRAEVAVQFAARDGRLEATVQRIAPDAYAPLWSLYVFDHQTMTTSEIAVKLPANLLAETPTQTIVVEALAKRRLVDQPRAPDGYEFRRDRYGNSGLVGSLFGMHGYDRRVSIVNNGRVIRIPLPQDDQYGPAVDAIGWLVDDAPR